MPGDSNRIEENRIDTTQVAAAENLSPTPARDPLSTAAAALAVEKVQALFEAMNNPNIVNFSRVSLWLSEGADVDLDILPAIRETTRRQCEESPDWCAHYLQYYDRPVRKWRDQRMAPMRPGRQFRQPTYDVKAAIAEGSAAARARLAKDDQ